MTNKMQMYIEIKNSKGGLVTTKTEADKFSQAVYSQFGGISKNATIQEFIKLYNAKNEEGNTARLVVEVNNKRIGESKKLAEAYLAISEVSDEDIEMVNRLEAKQMKEWIEDVFDAYNDLLDITPKINVRDADIKKEWEKVDKAFDGILKIYKKKYAKA